MNKNFAIIFARFTLFLLITIFYVSYYFFSYKLCFYLILLAVGSDEPVTAYLVFELWSSRFTGYSQLQSNE